MVGLDWHGQARSGGVGRVWYGEVRRSWRGKARRGLVWQENMTGAELKKLRKVARPVARESGGAGRGVAAHLGALGSDGRATGRSEIVSHRERAR